MFVDTPTDSLITFVKNLNLFNLSIDIDDWVKELDSINPYTVDPNMSFDLVMVVEETPSDYKKISMIQFYSQFQKEQALLTVSMIDICDMIYNFNADLPYIDEPFRQILTMACKEGSIYLKHEKPIPVDLLSKLIKLKVLIQLSKSIYENQQQAAALSRSEYFVPPPPPPKAAAGKKGKGKKDNKNAKKGKGAKGKGGVPSNQCDQVLNKNRSVRKERVMANIPTVKIYIVLIGFYLPDLITFLHANGLRLNLMVRFQGKRLRKGRSAATLETVGSIILEEGERVLEKDLYLRKSLTLKSFWNRIHAMFNEYRPFYLDDAFIMNYVPSSTDEEMKSSHVYFHLSEAAFLHFVDALNRCQEFRRLHQIYLENLKVYDLGYASLMSTDNMPIYKLGMDCLPIDVENQSFVLDSLLDEVISREKKTRGMDELEYKSRLLSTAGVAKVHEISPPSQSRSSSKLDCDKLGHLYATKDRYFADYCNIPSNYNCHKDFRAQLQRVIMYQSENHTGHVKENNVPVYEFLPDLHTSPYIVHESNIIDASMYYYKYIPECVKNVWKESLTRHPYVELCTQLPELPSTELSRYRKQFGEWSYLLGLDVPELTNCMLLMLYGKTLCKGRYQDNSNVDTFAEQYFYTQKVEHNIPHRQTDLVCMKNSPLPETEENHYEKLIPTEFKWSEELPPIVALQEFQRAYEEFSCVDRKPIGMLNAVLFRFHNDCDEFGQFQKKWNVTLRTPVTFKDFMHFVVFKDTAFILEHEHKYKSLELFYEDIVRFEKEVRNFCPGSDDFLIPDSLKYSWRYPPVASEVQDGKKGKKTKGKDKGAKVSKVGNKLPAKGGKKQDVNPREVIEAESFKSGIDFEDLIKCKAIRKHISQLSLPAIDYTTGLLTAGGCTTTFHSLDDFTVTIDICKTNDNPDCISGSVMLNGNNLFIHHNIKEGFAFHVTLKNGGSLAFGKPLCLSSKKERFYLIEEMYAKRMNCLGGFFPKVKQLVMRASDFYDAVRLKEIEEQEGKVTREYSFPAGQIKRFSKFSARSLSSRRTSWFREPPTTKRITSLSKVPSFGGATTSTSIHSRGKNFSKLTMSILPDGPFTVEGFAEDILSLRQHFRQSHFKIISSRLHKYSYISRKRSDLEIALKDVVRFILQNVREKNKYIRIKKAFDLDIKRPQSQPNADFDFRITLPNGLHIKNIQYTDGTYIYQTFLHKGPISANVCDEEYRLFLRDGSIAVKKMSGSFVIYRADGEIITYQIPLKKRVYRSFYLFKRKCSFKDNVEKLISTAQRRIKRMNRHIIDGYNCLNSVSRCKYRTDIKKFNCGRNKLVLIKDIKFHMVAYDGHTLQYQNGKFKRENGYAFDTEEQISKYQTVFRRVDGTIHILNKSGTLQTTFPDSTRITSWCEFDNAVVVDLRTRFGLTAAEMHPFIKINNYFQYEHLSYAAVTLDATVGDMKFTIPGGLEFLTCDDEYTAILDHGTLIKINKSKIEMQGLPCEDCKKACLCRVNIKPLYQMSCGGSEMFLEAIDTYGKLFIAYYDGSCKRNTDYNRDEMLCGCTMHRRQPTQKIMVVYDDLKAKLLWSEAMYANRMAESLISENDQLVLYINDKSFKVETTELRIYESEHYNNRFSMKYLPSMVYKHNDDEEEKIDFITQAAFIKHRLLTSISMSNLRYLLDRIQENHELMSSRYVKEFDVRSFSLLCEPVASIQIENFLDTIKPKVYPRSTYTNKISIWKQKCTSLLKEIQQAKDIKNVVPYFKKKEQDREKSTIKIYIQDNEGNLFPEELHSEVSGISNRSMTGSIYDTNSISTSMTGQSFTLFDRIETDNYSEPIYQREKSFSVTIEGEQYFSNNKFDSIAGIEDLIVTPIEDKINTKREITYYSAKTDNSDLGSRSEQRTSQTLPEVASIADSLTFPKSPPSPETSHATHTRTESVDEEDESKSSFPDLTCAEELHTLLKDIVLKAMLEQLDKDDLENSSPDSEFNSLMKTKSETNGEPESIRFSDKLEQLFNVVQKEGSKTKIEIPPEPLASHSRLNAYDQAGNSFESATDFSNIEFGKDYVTSPSLEAMTSQMIKPIALQEFSNTEIQTLLEEANIPPLKYHECSEIELVKQLMGIRGSNRDQKHELVYHDLVLPDYETLLCESERKGYDDDQEILGSEEEFLTSSSSSTSNKNQCKDYIGDEEGTNEEEDVEEDASSSSILAKARQKMAQYSEFSLKPSLFDFPINDGDSIPRDTSMIPLFDEKSLLRTINNNLKKTPMNVPIAEKVSDKGPTISTTTDSEPIDDYTMLSTKETSSSIITSSSYMSRSVPREEDEKEETLTPSSSTLSGIDAISPSLRVLQDRTSVDARYYNVLVESIGVSTDKQTCEITETDLPYGDEFFDEK